MDKEELRKKFEELSQPLIDFINENYHPNCVVVLDCAHAELLEGIISMNSDKLIK